MEMVVITLLVGGIMGLGMGYAENGLCRAVQRHTIAPLHLTKVKAEGEIGRRINLAIYENFMRLDIDKDFLDPFRHPKPAAQLTLTQSFIGLGMLIDAAVLMAEYSGDSEVRARKEYLIEETLKAQSPDGYIGIFAREPDALHLFRSYCFHDAAYVILGLVRDYEVFGNRASLSAAEGLAEYMISNWPKRPVLQDVLCTTCGVTSALIALHAATGQERYLEFAAGEKLGKGNRIKFASLREWDQEISPGGPTHAYRLFERCISQLRLNRLEPDENLQRMSHRIYRGLTHPERAGMVITGTVSKAEVWHEDQDGSGSLGETCATVHLLWYLEELMRLDGKLGYGDVMERAIYNHLFAAQDPEGRRIRYYTPFSGERAYHPGDTYCCPNNFRRGMARLPQHIYYRWDSGVAVNLYTTSTANLELEDGVQLTIRQQTDYPTSGHVHIIVEPSRPAQFSVRLRVPRWCPETKVTVNDESAQAEIHRKWQKGDVISVDMPMSWRLIKGRQVQAGRVAVMRGPVVYCLSRTLNHLPKDMTLRDITVDPESLKLIEDNRLRPGGLACRVKAWSPGVALSEPPGLDLILNEFPEPSGEEVYFKVPDIAVAVDDELIE